MKAAAFTDTGGPQVIQLFELEDPIPGPEDVIIEMKAIGLNFADIYRRRGTYVSEPPAPYVLGYEGAGIVVALGNKVREFSKGDRVGFAHVPRANAELVRAPAWKVIPLPEAISFDTAASILLQGLTAHYLAQDSFHVNSTSQVLIHSAAGGVGLLLLQICKLLDAKAIGTVSNPAKAAAAIAAGADHVVVRTEDWKQQVLKLSGGVDVVYDGIGTTLLESLSVVKPHGTVVYFGQAGGEPPRVDPNQLMSESKVLVGGELWTHIATREALRKRAAILFSWLEQGKIRIPFSTKFTLAKTPDAHRALETGNTQGKLLLTPQ